MIFIDKCNNSNQCEIVTTVLVNLSSDNMTEGGDIQRFLAELVKGVGRLFYIVRPSETTYENAKDVPNFFYNVSIFF